MMNRIIYIIIAVFVFIATGCRTTKTVSTQPPIILHERDSVRVETKTVTIYERDTVTIEIPAQTAERTTPDSLSTLENDFAISTARINPDGTLFHTLFTIPGKFNVPFDKPIQKTENTRIQYKEIEKPVPVEVPVEVERKLTWWQSTCIKFFPWALGVIFAALVYVFRKPILNFARRMLGSK